MGLHTSIKCVDCVHLVPRTQVCMEYKASVDGDSERNCYFYKVGAYAEAQPAKVKGKPKKKVRKKALSSAA